MRCLLAMVLLPLAVLLCDKPPAATCQRFGFFCSSLAILRFTKFEIFASHG